MGKLNNMFITLKKTLIKIFNWCYYSIMGLSNSLSCCSYASQYIGANHVYIYFSSGKRQFACSVWMGHQAPTCSWRLYIFFIGKRQLACSVWMGPPQRDTRYLFPEILTYSINKFQSYWCIRLKISECARRPIARTGITTLSIL